MKPTTKEIKTELKRITKDLGKYQKFLEHNVREESVCQGWIEALTWVLGEEEAT